MKQMLLILSILFLITSCTKEETEQNESLISSKWTLIKYEPGFSPTENFLSGQILWNFQQNSTLSVEVDNSLTNPPLKAEGTYQFVIKGKRISIDDEEFDFSVSQNILTISDDPSADGFRATFHKSN